MLGLSIYLHELEKNSLLENLSKISVSKVFTTCHMPEYDFDVVNRLKYLFKTCKEKNIELFADLDKNFYLKNQKELNKLLKEGLCLRLDYGFSDDDTIRLSKNNKIAINASTIDCDQLNYLEENGINKENLIFWHNFYPKKYTGLSKEFFAKKNELFKSRGYEVYAFVSGNKNLRPPMKEYLPTVEEFRGQNPFVGYLKMIIDYKVDCVFVSEGIKTYDLSLINSYIENSLIRIPAKILDSYKDLSERVFTNRPDESIYLIRAKESRDLNLKVKVENTIDRKKGSITLDNKDFKRYEGELNLVKKDLEKDRRVNVIGEVLKTYIELLDYIKGGGEFILDEKHD